MDPSVTTSTRHSPLGIPEIIERILSYLAFSNHGKDLIPALSVCRVWYQASHPLRYRTIIHDDSREPKNSLQESLKQLSDADCFRWTSFQDPEGMVAFCSELRVGRISGSFPLRELHLRGDFDLKVLGNAYSKLQYLTSMHIHASGSFEIYTLLDECSQLEHVYLEGTIEIPMTSQGYALSGQYPCSGWQPPLYVSSSCTLRLESLTMIGCQVYRCTIIDILAVSPRLTELALVAIKLPTYDRYMDFKTQDLVSFLPEACPKLQRLHISPGINDRRGENLAERYIVANPEVREWSFVFSDVTPALFRTLDQVPNVVTYLEIIGKKSESTDLHTRSTSFGWIDSVRAGLHDYLCVSPNLLHLKTHQVLFAPESFNPFPKDLQECQQKNHAALDETCGKIWACRTLISLSLHIVNERPETTKWTRTTVQQSTMRTMLGYLTMVCPKVKRLHLELHDAELGLASGLCLLSRMQELEKLTFCFRNAYQPGRTPKRSTNARWVDTLDVSWMVPNHNMIPMVTKALWRAMFVAWRLQAVVTLQDHGLIRKRLAYLEAPGSRFVRNFGGPTLWPWEHLGTLLDVENCLANMSVVKKGHYGHGCWPRLKVIYAVSDDGSEEKLEEFNVAVGKVRPRS
ncbi:hypothetical protein BG004_003256 [Podila humilis]|nr:hypothetical protein BG004_003256 [Podila humilis]